QPLTAYLGVAMAVLPANHEWVQQAKQTQNEQLALLREQVSIQESAAQSSPLAIVRPQLLQGLEQLKEGYIQRYLDFHRSARLNPDQDDRKKRLLNEPRRKQLVALAEVDKLPVAGLTKWEEKLAALQPCYGLGASDLKDRPFCARCGYRPVEEPNAPHPTGVLDEAEARLGELHGNWITALLTTLAQEAPQHTIKLMTSTQQTMINNFLSQRTLPDKIPQDFVEAIREAFRGLVEVRVPPEDILRSITEGGTPCTVQELHNRFRQFIESLTDGHNPNKVRIVIEW
ncbi:MAG: hypothetical protein KDJ65_34010, partial [Anaerolineae bacterium]|nr:hypothetical protein [Anaerolineae bacterium]